MSPTMHCTAITHNAMKRDNAALLSHTIPAGFGGDMILRTCRHCGSSLMIALRKSYQLIGPPLPMTLRKIHNDRVSKTNYTMGNTQYNAQPFE